MLTGMGEWVKELGFKIHAWASDGHLFPERKGTSISAIALVNRTAQYMAPPLVSALPQDQDCVAYTFNTNVETFCSILSPLPIANQDPAD